MRQTFDAKRHGLQDLTDQAQRQYLASLRVPTTQPSIAPAHQAPAAAAVARPAARVPSTSTAVVGAGPAAPSQPNPPPPTTPAPMFPGFPLLAGAQSLEPPPTPRVHPLAADHPRETEGGRRAEVEAPGHGPPAAAGRKRKREGSAYEASTLQLMTVVAHGSCLAVVQLSKSLAGGDASAEPSMLSLMSLLAIALREAIDKAIRKAPSG